jgi:hypothetical protein
MDEDMLDALLGIDEQENEKKKLYEKPKQVSEGEGEEGEIVREKSRYSLRDVDSMVERTINPPTGM